MFCGPLAITWDAVINVHSSRNKSRPLNDTGCLSFPKGLCTGLYSFNRSPRTSDSHKVYTMGKNPVPEFIKGRFWLPQWQSMLANLNNKREVFKQNSSLQARPDEIESLSKAAGLRKKHICLLLET